MRSVRTDVAGWRGQCSAPCDISHYNAKSWGYCNSSSGLSREIKVYFVAGSSNIKRCYNAYQSNIINEKVFKIVCMFDLGRIQEMDEKKYQITQKQDTYLMKIWLNTIIFFYLI